MNKSLAMVGTALLASSFTVHATAIAASDRLLISRLGLAVFDQSIAEGVQEQPRVFGAPITFPDDLQLTTPVVLVLESPGEPLAPNADVLTVPNPADPNHPFIVSDAIARLAEPGPHNFRILFGSHGDPFLRPACEILSGLQPSLSIVFETGDLQDVTTLLGLTNTDFSVAFQSAVPVPLPGAWGMLASSACEIAAPNAISCTQPRLPLAPADESCFSADCLAQPVGL